MNYGGRVRSIRRKIGTALWLAVFFPVNAGEICIVKETCAKN